MKQINPLKTFKLAIATVFIVWLLLILFSFTVNRYTNIDKALNSLYDLREWIRYDVNNEYVPRDKGEIHIEVINDIIYLLEEENFVEYNNIKKFDIPMKSEYQIELVNQDSVKIYSIRNQKIYYTHCDSIVSTIEMDNL